MKILLTILLFLGYCDLFAAIDLSGRWTNDWYEFFTKTPKDSVWTFQGADLHEGGYGFQLKVTGDSSFLLMDREDGFPANVGKKGDRVTYRVVGGHRTLIIHSPSGTIEYVFRSIDNSRTMYQIISTAKTAYQLAGTYRDEVSGREVSFYPGSLVVKGLPDVSSQSYLFEISDGFPVDVIVFENEVKYWYVRTDSGLDLYGTKRDGSYGDSWVRGKKLRTLKRTAWIDQTGGKYPGKFGFASETLLTPMVLAYFSAAERRIMRNEIYARHGYIFKSPDLQSYFTAQPWYKPIEGAGEAQLSDLEKLNARTIADHPAPHHN